ncbi:putative ICE protein [Streptococcus pneumoniae]|nr:putative ICE protein [Streptococcus pneumoniae]VIV11706.1 putative ICE protein [Streptococcus pneumoniae]VIV61728.1 putative ICE protein [Streptococcus pneumoniae]VIV82433.1 putative ICE protein [Streptococcus pneumoniae]VJD48825.1 putative ICE protein [Streptococcus pneumoniae]
MKETVVVLAISTKKERGWIKVSTLNDCWSDLGMHFDKSKFGAVFSAPGLYEVEVINNASFGQNPQYEVTQCRKIGSFSELVELAKIK